PRMEGARAAAVVRERLERMAPPAEAELQRVVAAERVREEVGAVRLHFPRVPRRLIAARQRAAVEAGRVVVERLDVPEAAGVTAGVDLVGGGGGALRAVA